MHPIRAWVADITAIWTAEGWLYLAIVLDLFSRMVVGWAMDSHRDALLVEQACLMALARRRPEPGLMHHWDRGSQ
jgi:putative transposase